MFFMRVVSGASAERTRVRVCSVTHEQTRGAMLCVVREGEASPSCNNYLLRVGLRGFQCACPTPPPPWYRQPGCGKPIKKGALFWGCIKGLLAFVVFLLFFFFSTHTATLQLAYSTYYSSSFCAHISLYIDSTLQYIHDSSGSSEP